MSGQLALSVVGAGVGFLAGGNVAAGWAIGSAIGGALFAPGGKDQRQPLLEDLAVESGSYGTPIPKIFGQMRVRGILVWQSERRPTRHKERTGKGGGGGSITTYTYSMDVMVMLCEAPITAVRKIYLNGKLYYSRSPDADLETLANTDEPWDDLRIHLGGASQLPDPTYEAAIGEGLVPAYRDVVTIMFENLQLEDFGNNPPNITAEVVTGPVTYLGPTIPDGVNTTGVPGTAGSGQWIRSDEGVIDYWVDKTVIDFGTPRVYQLDFEKWTIGGVLLEETSITYSAAVDGPIFCDGGTEGINPRIAVRNLSGVYAGVVGNNGSGCTSSFSTWASNSPSSGIPLTNPNGDPLVYLNGVSQIPGAGAPHQIGFAHYFEGYIYVIPGPAQSGGTTILYRFPAPDGVPSPHADREYTSFPYALHDLIVDAAGVWVIGGNTGNNQPYFIAQLDHDLVLVDLWTGNNGTTMISYKSGPHVRDGQAIVTQLTGTKYRVVQLVNGSPSTITTIEEGDVVGEVGGTSNGYLIPVGDMVLSNNQYITHGLPDPENLTLANVETQLCVEAGLTANDIDVTELTDLVIGYARTNPASVSDMNKPLQPAYQFDVISSDWQLKFPKRARPSIALTVPYTELSAHLWGQDTPEPLSLTRTPDRELLRRVHVDYLSEARDYQTNSQYAGREAIDSKDEEALQLAMLLEDDQARQIAEIYLADNWASRDSYPLSLGLKYLALDPTDVIAVETPSAAHLMRITNIDLALPGLLTIQAASVRAPALIDEALTVGDDYVYEEDFDDTQIDEPYTSTAPGAAAPIVNESAQPVGPTDLELLDLPIQRDADDYAGLYWASRGYTSGWAGSVVFRSADGTAYTEVDSVFRAATMGYATTVLASGSLTVIDQASTVNVRVSGEIVSITEAQFHNRENLGLLGDHGRWEVFAFRDATLEANGTYTLDYMLRGLRGTDHNIGNHTATDRFVLLTGPGIDRFVSSVDDDAVVRYYKGVSIGKALSSADAQTLTSNTESLRPLSPVHVKGKRVSGGDLTISWVRRTRIAQTWGVANLAPLGEASESYSIDILNGSSVVRTLTSSTQSVAYTAAQQTTDFGSAQASVSVRVYQISATVGRGTGRSATI